METIRETPDELKRSQKYFHRSFYLMFCKFLPKRDQTRWRIFNAVKLSIFPLLIFNCGIWTANDAIRMKIAEDQTKFSYLMVYLAATYQSMWKYLIFLAYREKFKKIGMFMKELEDSLKTDDLASEIRRQELPKELKFYVIFSGTYLRTTFVAALIVCSHNSYITNFTAPFMLSIPYLHWSLNFLFQSFFVVVLCAVIIGSDIVLTISVGFLAGELTTITKLASKINEEGKRSERILKNIYLLHVRVQQILDELRKIYWQMSLHIVLSNFVMVCLYLYTTRYLPISMPNVVTLLNVTFQLIIFCSMGQVLLDRTEGVAEALWQSSWYDLNLEDQKRFSFILKMAQIPKGISASDVTIISANTLVQVLKTSLTFAAFLYSTIN